MTALWLRSGGTLVNWTGTWRTGSLWALWCGPGCRVGPGGPPWWTIALTQVSQSHLLIFITVASFRRFFLDRAGRWLRELGEKTQAVPRGVLR